MNIQSLIRSSFILSSAFLLFAGGLAQAQDAELVELGRDEAQLRSDIKVAIDRDTDVADTALVFNNASRRVMTVFCKAFSSNGNVIGRGKVEVPPMGVKFIRASDLSNGVDYIGSATCAARRRLLVSAIFLAPGSITNLNVSMHHAKRATRVRFPLVATY